MIRRTMVALLVLLTGCIWDVHVQNDGGEGDAVDSHDAYNAGGDDSGIGDDVGRGDDAGRQDAGCVPGDVPIYPDTDPSNFPPGLTAEYIRGLAKNFPDAAMVEEVQQGGVTFYRALDADSFVLGYAFASQAYGWCGMLVIITGFSPEAVTIRVEPVEYCWGEWIYSVTSLLDSLRCIDLTLIDYHTRNFGPYDVDAVSGATITSDAIINAFWNAVALHDQVF